MHTSVCFKENGDSSAKRNETEEIVDTDVEENFETDEAEKNYARGNMVKGRGNSD